jgi:IS30 family transposase
MKTYHQLTQVPRYQIYALRRTNHTQAEIAKVIGVHKSSVSRELKRNQGKRGYRPQQAHELALERRSKSISRITARDWTVVEKLLKWDWSPEQISGRLKKEQSFRISHEWIYQHVLIDKQASGDLYKHLRCQKKRRKRYGTYNRRGKLPNCRSIEERPARVATRKRLGDWEVATLIGRQHKQAMVTLTERKSRFTLVSKVNHRTTSSVRKSICKLLSPVKAKAHTLTSDHGKEFAEHEQIAKTLDLTFYFAHPYAAWERGTNENTNGLLRQYFPKKCDFQSVSNQEIELAMSRLNFRPRKSLRFKTPFDVFYTTSVALTS